MRYGKVFRLVKNQLQLYLNVQLLQLLLLGISINDCILLSKL